MTISAHVKAQAARFARVFAFVLLPTVTAAAVAHQVPTWPVIVSAVSGALEVAFRQVFPVQAKQVDTALHAAK